MNIKEQLRKKRNENNMTQEQIAEMIFVSRQTISNWENGKSYPDIKSLILLCDIYKISLDELVRGDVELMRKEISKTKVIATVSMMAFSLMLYLIGLALMSRTSGDLKNIAVIITVGSAVATLFFSIKAKFMKKKAKIRTYSDILAFFDEQ